MEMEGALHKGSSGDDESSPQQAVRAPRRVKDPRPPLVLHFLGPTGVVRANHQDAAELCWQRRSLIRRYMNSGKPFGRRLVGAHGYGG